MAVLTFCWTPVKKLTANNALFFLCKNGSWIPVMKLLADVVLYLGPVTVADVRIPLLVELHRPLP